MTVDDGLDQLRRLVDKARDRRSKLVLIVGPHGSGKTALLRGFGEARGLTPVSLGAALARRLVALPPPDRPLDAGALVREIADIPTAADNSAEPGPDPVLLDNIEILFDPTLKLAPLNLLVQIARNRPIIANWPGELRVEGDRRLLIHAVHGHAEHLACPPDGALICPVR